MNFSRRFLIGLLALSGACPMFTAAPAQAGFYSAAADFSATTNPNGVWSYGYSTTLGSAFNLDTTTASASGLNLWEGTVPGADSLLYPFVAHNGTASTITSGTVQYLPGQLGVQPGPQDQYAIVRFTAPTAGTFTLNASFTGLDFSGPTTTDVHVLLDGASIFNGLVNGYGPGSASSFASTLTLNLGDTVDFAVGYGSNNTYFNDTTGISATFSTVPEPSSIVLASIAGVLAAGTQWRRRRSRV